MDTKDMTREQISALSDGELASQHTDVTLAALRRPDVRADWEIYHQIGDVLRSDDMAASLSPAFSQRMFARLEMEPAIVAPANLPAPEHAAADSIARRLMKGSAKRWAMPGMVAAVVATVAFVATPQIMVAMKSGPELSDSPAMMASAGRAETVKTAVAAPLATEQVVAVTTTAPEGVVLRDPRIDDYLLAHQRFSPSMYSTAQFARSATVETGPGK